MILPNALTEPVLPPPDYTGVYDLSIEAYHQHPAISNTGLGHMLRSPAHYAYFRQNPPEPTPAMKIGTAAHMGILEPDRFYKTYCAAPQCDRRTTAGKAIYEKFLFDNEGKTPLAKFDFDNIECMIEAAYAHPTVSNLLKGGVTEQSLFWKDEATGVQCRLRTDYLRADRIVVDLKKTKDASKAAFQRSVFNFGYHRQGAFYLDGLRAVFGEQVGFVLIAIEDEAPYGIGVYALDDLALQVGWEQYRKALNLYANCLKTDSWPSYPTETQALGCPNWVQA